VYKPTEEYDDEWQTDEFQPIDVEPFHRQCVFPHFQQIAFSELVRPESGVDVIVAHQGQYHEEAGKIAKACRNSPDFGHYTYKIWYHDQCDDGFYNGYSADAGGLVLHRLSYQLFVQNRLFFKLLSQNGELFFHFLQFS
jgi:hypothetical protein